MKAADIAAVAMVGGLILAILWLVLEIEALRRDLEPLVTSPLARTAAALGG
jgi:hypothetical protein